MATTWDLLPGAIRSCISTQTTSESVPTLATEGLNLDSVAGFVLIFSCDLGEFFNNAASVFKAYRYDPFLNRWARAAEHDVTVGTANVNERDFAVAFQVSTPRGRIAHIASSIGVSGGGLTLRYITTQLVGTDA